MSFTDSEIRRLFRALGEQSDSVVYVDKTDCVCVMFDSGWNLDRVMDTLEFIEEKLDLTFFVFKDSDGLYAVSPL